MSQSTRSRLIPVAVVGVIAIGAIVLLSSQGAAPACGAFVVTADRPLTLESGASVALAGDAGELRFDSHALSQADLSAEANAQVLTAVNAMPVNLRAQDAILTFVRCGETPIPIHLESPAPDASLDAYGWDGTQWMWLAGSTQQLSVDLPDLPQAVAWVESLPIAPIIGTQPDPRTGGLDPQYDGIITEIYAPGLNVAANGSVTGQVPAAPEAGAPYMAYPVVRNLTAGGQPDAAALQAMLSDAAARENHAKTLVTIATGSNFAGIAIDYGPVDAAQREAYAAFIEDLANTLHANGKQLAVALPLPGGWRAGQYDDTAGYDWQRIGRAVDIIHIDLPLALSDFQPNNGVPSALKWAASQASRGKIQPIVRAASVRGDSAQPEAISFAEAGAGLLAAVETTTISGTLGAPLTVQAFPSMTLAMDNATGVYDYHPAGEVQPADGSSIRTAATLAQQLKALPELGLRGALIRDVQGPDVAPNLLEPIRAYRQQTSIGGSGDLNVEWSVAASDGSVVLQASQPLTNPDLRWTPDRDGAYIVKAAIASATREVARVTVGAGAAPGDDTPPGQADACYSASYVSDVTVPDNTRFDKGEDFVKTWKVRNSGTCAWDADTEIAFVRGSQLGAGSPVAVGALAAGQSIDVSVPMKSGDADGSFTGLWQLRNQDGAFGDQLSVVIKVGAEVAAPPPSAGGKTEYGIHAHFYGYAHDYESGAATITNLTNELGLGWVKIQFRWGDYDYFCGGADLNVLNTMVNRANAAGLKVLISVVTSPPCKHPWTSDVHAPPDDPNEFAGLVGGLADFYRGRIHGIEIWNEQNIDREWKTNPQTLDANRYTQMLAAAYNAIKSKDPNILVISGALAPTGVNNGVTATDDFTYLQQMVAAGASKYMDCVGTHVNALRVPPSAGLGGPYDSLFNPPHHSWYFKDTVQGYQSITGKPACVTEFGVATQEGVGAVSGFEWAANNTQQNQADWVIEGMSLCRQWGCRLMILWNLDYGPATGTVNDNALYSFLDMGGGKRPVFTAVKNWCAANGCR